MGLLDWLTEGTGLDSGSAMPPMNPMGDPTGGSMQQLPPGMPPMQGLDLPTPPMEAGGLPAPNSMGGPAAPPMPPGLTDNPMGDQGGSGGPLASPPAGPGPMAAEPGPQAMPPISPGPMAAEAGPQAMPPGIPMPQPRPPGAQQPPPPGAPTDVGASGRPAGPPMDLTSAAQSYQRAGGNLAPPPDSSPGRLSLLRAMGIDANTANRMRGSLGEGLKSVPANSSAPGLAAFSGSLGAGIEGGKKADDKTVDQQDKYLARAIAAKKEGNNAEYQKNYLRYQIENAKAKLDAAKEKAASGSGSVMNSPEQLYLRAIGATNQDGGLKVLANKVREAQKLGPESPEAKAATAEYEKKFKEVRDGHLGTLGVDPSKIKGMESKPGFSDKNPVKDFPKDPAGAQKAFDALPEGAYFVNPKDGRLLIKKGQQPAPAGGPAANPAQSGIGPPIPPIPTAPALAHAEEE